MVHNHGGSCFNQQKLTPVTATCFVWSSNCEVVFGTLILLVYFLFFVLGIVADNIAALGPLTASCRELSGPVCKTII